MKKKIHKITAVYLALSLLFQTFFPTMAWALTNGPSQPEMEAFEPIGTTEMVDPFSGDFNYNIPLMTVPGPNGGYPLNLAYHAGPSMEEEASWVGLGWNINVGEISRQMRGLPDDFDGDVVEKHTNMKPNQTATVGLTLAAEVVSADFEKLGGSAPSGPSSVSASISLTWNSYKGIGLGFGQGLRFSGQSGSFGGSLNYNSMSGETSISPSLSYNKLLKGSASLSLGFSYGSVDGMKSLSLSYSRTKKTGKVYFDEDDESMIGGHFKDQTKTRSGGAGINFSGSSYIPNADMPMGGYSVSTAFTFGPDAAFVHLDYGGQAFYSENRVAVKDINLKAYGYLNSEKRDGKNKSQAFALMDFNRDKDVDLVRDVPAMPVPVFTNDVFFAKGQGVGGSFRAYRSDIGILHDPVITSKNTGGNLTAEVGLGNPVKVGSDISVSYSSGYQGPWRDLNTWDKIHTQYQFKGKDLTAPLYESTYFRNAADMTANYNEAATTPKGTTAPLGIEMNFGYDISNFADPDIEDIEQPLADVFITSKASLGAEKLTERVSRSQSMSYKTNKELKYWINNSLSEGFKSDFSNKTIYNLNEYPRTATGSNPAYNTNPDSHIGEITILNSDGNRYIYGIAAYNNKSKEVTFSVEGGSTNNLVQDKILVDYSSQDVSDNNNKGDDNFYSHKTVPKYAHTYLLTAIVSPDYVDLHNDGLTEDDYGYYVKFNYTKTASAYKWRSPFTKANYMEGSNNHTKDDKASYMYGEKEIWYVTSIETKTHVAEFKLTDRMDGYDVMDEHNGANAGPAGILGGNVLKKIEKIDLYSKQDPNYLTTPTPIKTVHFRYSYDLCESVQNNIGTPQYAPEDVNNAININAKGGKLTLKKVWFTYFNNHKGELSPYEFDYDETSTTRNPAFSTLKMDRWGHYKPGTFIPESPYVNQADNISADKTDRDDAASAWSLRKVFLPSGGTIEVDYESDDYAYVQDKQAMQMAKIIGTGYWESGTFYKSASPGEITGKNKYIIFQLENQSAATPGYVKDHLKGISEIYFKTFLHLKKEIAGGPEVSDYVSGYAPIVAVNAGSDYGVYQDAGINYGYVKLADVPVHDAPALSGLDKTNPIRKAGWQYLKLNRTDLLYPSSNNNLGNNPATSALLQLAAATVGYFTSQIKLFTGYYNYCIANGFCKRIDLANTADFPSFIRVNSPDYIKYGGGHRVSKIAITDTWAGESTVDESKYGQQFTYRLEDNKSSGVAEYEPLLGGEEISLREPIRYSSDYKFVKHDDLFLEKPYCEAYYPAAGVGYSRVIVSGIKQKDNLNADVEEGVQGHTEHQFYTAKDFPVIATPSDLTQKRFTPNIPIPFIGSVTFENYGYSQTYTVETNNMHGKQKSMATYAYKTDMKAPGAVPLTKTEYIYKTDVPYSSNASNHLNNEVDVLYDDAFYKTSNIGLTKEFFMDMRERSNVSLSVGMQANVEVSYVPPIPVVVPLPTIDYAEELNKMVVGMNIISRNGILVETRQYSEGSMAKTSNLMFDAKTGTPLLTTVTNNFDAPVYTYKYAAHWAYEKGVGAAYKNIGAEFVLNGSMISGVTAALSVGGDQRNLFTKGDEVALIDITGPNNNPIKKYWVTDVTQSNVELRDAMGVAHSSSLIFKGVITRSGRRNQLTATDGTIVSLRDPMKDGIYPLIEEFNAANIEASLVPLENSYYITSDKCYTIGDGTVNGFTVKPYINGPNQTQIFFQGNNGSCEFFMDFPVELVGDITLKVINKKLYAVVDPSQYNGAGPLIKSNSNFATNCFAKCPISVLHADATELDDNWQFDFEDVQANARQANSIPDYANTGLNTSNKYSWGGLGIWRIERTHLYQVNRKQLNPTYIALDGEYDHFQFFDWEAAAAGSPTANPNWTWTSEITRYNPVGYEIENKDRLQIYSTALYGYDNSVQTAIAQNASYFETAFDGFEDYNASGLQNGHGHIQLLQQTGSINIVNTISHTGKKSLMLQNNTLDFFSNTTPNHPYFTTKASKKYVMSLWVNGALPTISVTEGGGSIINSTVTSADIDGWKKIDVTFTTSAATNPSLTFTITTTGTTYIDDIRFHPFKSSIKTYVYDPITLRFVAELDNQNFATFYNYDEEGILVQVKKETERGVSTIKTTRSNTKRQ